MKKRRGFILITAFLAIVILFILSGIFVMSSLTEHKAAQKQMAIAKAFYLAEAGVDDAIVNLRSDDAYAGTSPTTSALGTQGVFETKVTTPDSDNPKIKKIESWGYVPAKDPSAYGYQVKKVEAYVEVTPRPLFDLAVFTQQDVDLNNSKIDSYNSSVAPYDPNNPGSNGDIGTNNSGTGADGEIGEVNIVDGDGKSTVNGDACVGPTIPYWDAISLSGKAEITGDQYNLAETIDFPPITIPQGLTDLGNLKITSGTTQLPGGDYWYSSISISGNGGLSFTGPTTLYITGDVSISGNGLSTSGNLPSNLIINVIGTHNVNVMGEAGLYGAIYAPDSAVKLGDGGKGVMYGSIVAHEVKMMNADLHYDEALRNVLRGVGYIVKTLAWNEALTTAN